MNKNTIQEHFQRAATHHARLAKRHRGLSAACEKALQVHKAAKSDVKGPEGPALEDLLLSFAEHHGGAADEHDDMAEHCSECSKADFGGDLAKLAEALGNTLRPTEVRTVIPSAPGYMMVPRHGQQQAPAKPNVDSQFSKLVSVGDVDDPSVLTQ